MRAMQSLKFPDTNLVDSQIPPLPVISPPRVARVDEHHFFANHCWRNFSMNAESASKS